MEFSKNIEKRIDGHGNENDEIVVMEPAKFGCSGVNSFILWRRRFTPSVNAFAMSWK
jgi:hypothetical protein